MNYNIILNRLDCINTSHLFGCHFCAPHRSGVGLVQDWCRAGGGLV